MNRKDLISRLVEQNPELQSKDAALVVKTIVDALCSALAQGGRVEIRGFGSFALHYKPAYQGRNPKTGAKILVQGRFVPRFKAGKELRERVRSD